MPPFQVIGGDLTALPGYMIEPAGAERADRRPEAPAEMSESLDAVRSPGELCDQVASAVLPGPAVRQALLEELDVERRLQRLTVALDDLLRQLTGDR